MNFGHFLDGTLLKSEIVLRELPLGFLPMDVTINSLYCIWILVAVTNELQVENTILRCNRWT